MRLSICTPSIDNSAAYIGEAIESVRAPPGIEIEHIIIHDGSDSFTRTLSAKYPHLRLLRGPGCGPTPAIAAGIAAARGDFVFLLNSDDRLVTGALDALQRAAAVRPEIDIWTGGTRLFRAGARGEEVSVRVLSSPSVIAATLSNVMDDLPLLNARFIRRTVYDRVGNMDLAFPASSDREFMIRVAMAGVREAPLGVMVSEMRIHEGSQTLYLQARSVPSYIAEHIRLADRIRAKGNVPAVLRTEMTRWRAREVLRLASYAWRAGQYRRSIAVVAHAIRVDPAWPINMMTAIHARRLRRRT